MFITVIATLCLQSICTDKTVTDQATMMECNGPFAMQALSKWMADEGYLARGYRLAGWKCSDAAPKIPA